MATGFSGQIWHPVKGGRQGARGFCGRVFLGKGGGVVQGGFVQGVFWRGGFWKGVLESVFFGKGAYVLLLLWTRYPQTHMSLLAMSVPSVKGTCMSVLVMSIT